MASQDEWDKFNQEKPAGTVTEFQVDFREELWLCDLNLGDKFIFANNPESHYMLVGEAGIATPPHRFVSLATGELFQHVDMSGKQKVYRYRNCFIAFRS